MGNNTKQISNIKFLEGRNYELEVTDSPKQRNLNAGRNAVISMKQAGLY